jgi:hypothetical protein
MSQFKITAVIPTNRLNKISRFARGLLLGSTLLALAGTANAASLVNSVNYVFKTALTNSGVDADATGTVQGSLIRKGAIDNQRLTLKVSKLDADATFHLIAFLDGNAAGTSVADFTTDTRGSSSIAYTKSTRAGPNPLPGAVDPLTNVRELDVVNDNGLTVLQADLTASKAFSYSVKQAMINTGFIPGAGGVAQLKGSTHATTASITATGLTPSTSYQLMVNGVGSTTKSSDAHGKLVVAAPKVGLELAIDIRTLALADTSGNIILTLSGLGIPGVLSTASQSPVVLGAAASYAVLGGSTVTSIGNTTVNGNIGLAPGSSVTGFPPGTVNGAIDISNPAADAAQAALTVAYNDAKGRTLAPVSKIGNLGGQTLPPGLYKSTSGMEITSGDLTLDAQGDANATFIFQIATTLNTSAGRQVILIGGAKAANVFWQVGTSATLATTTAFKGTIMADQSITLETGATLEGRALARIAAVTMDSNTITIPAP